MTARSGGERTVLAALGRIAAFWTLACTTATTTVVPVEGAPEGPGAAGWVARAIGLATIIAAVVTLYGRVGTVPDYLAPVPTPGKPAARAKTWLVVVVGVVATSALLFVDDRIRAAETETARAAAQLKHQAAAREADVRIAAERKRATEAAPQVALDAQAAREREAVATFPQQSVEIAAAYKRALNETSVGKWPEASSDLRLAENELSNFNGTGVAQTKAWLDLSTKVVALRHKVQPQMDRINEKQEGDLRKQEVSAEDEKLRQLLAQYKDNEVRADSIYKGKMVQFGGIVGEVKKDITDTIYVTVGTGEWQFHEVQCFFDDSKAPETAALTRGQHVRMRGTVAGLMMDVLVKNCDFVR